MFSLADVILFCTIVTVSNSDYCQDNFTLGEFPEGVRANAIAVFTQGTIDDFVGCSEDIEIDPNNIHFWLWNRANPITPIDLDKTNPKDIDGSKPIIFLVHGWLCSVTNDRIPQLKDAYLKRYNDANIIGIDWSAYSMELYSNSFCYIPKITPILGAFICNLNDNLNVDISKIHMIGHSMGGQICGLTGQEVQSQCSQILGRITGLDPAGPLYQNLAGSKRLDSSDAKIVDVIHTNQCQAGFYGSCGTVDYFPNCGYIQPGCLKLADINITQLLNSPLSAITCSHLRSADYLIESIASDEFVAKSCRTCPGIPLVGPCMVDLFHSSSSVMGEDYPEHPGTSNKYYLTTNSNSPFAKG